MPARCSVLGSGATGGGAAAVCAELPEAALAVGSGPVGAEVCAAGAPPALLDGA